MRVLVMVLLLGSAVLAQGKFNTDLDGDGRVEQVVLRTYQLEGVTLGQLQVLRGGKVVWAGPRASKPFDPSPWVFLGEFDYGDISFLGDYDADGKTDLVATWQKSDVRPTRYRLFHWEKGKFVFDRSAILAPLPQKPGTFAWMSDDPSRERWIEQISAGKNGVFEARYTDLAAKDAQNIRLRWQRDQGFTVIP